MILHEQQKQTLLELQLAILTNEALMANIYKKTLGKPSTVAEEVSQIALSIINYSQQDNMYSNPCGVKDYFNPYSFS